MRVIDGDEEPCIYLFIGFDIMKPFVSMHAIADNESTKGKKAINERFVGRYYRYVTLSRKQYSRLNLLFFCFFSKLTR